MAITWDVKITVQDVARKQVGIVATRTDSADPDNPEIIRIDSALIATGEQKVAVLDNIWEHHLALQTRNAAIAAFIGTLEADAKSNLEARE